MIRIFADGADIEAIRSLDKNPLIKGFTTNPTLARKAGVTDYEGFCKEVLSFTDKPVSFEVFADDFEEMGRQAKIIHSWGENVYVKIPIVNTFGQSAIPLIRALYKLGIKLNVTAVFTERQIVQIAESVDGRIPSIVSVFAGRIADTGIDPRDLMVMARVALPQKAQLLWASPREVLNIYQAYDCGCDIITCTPELIKKYEAMRGRDLTRLCIDTVEMFYNDGKAAGFTL